MSEDKGPQLKDYQGKYDSPDDDFRAWSVFRKKWLEFVSKWDRLYPFQSTKAVHMPGSDRPIPLTKKNQTKRKKDSKHVK